jgi:hypothetical protein
LCVSSAIVSPVRSPRRSTRLAEAFAFYEAVLVSPAVTLADKMKAQDGINHLAGLDSLDFEQRLEALEKALLTRTKDPRT